MDLKISRIVEVCAIAALAVICIFSTAWAGPPPPPDAIPRTPLGGMEVSIATAVGIAAYGKWKSRR